MKDEMEEKTDEAAPETDTCLIQAVARLSEDSLRKIWDNPEDADYDRL
jgi:hypothetical protein